MTEPNQIINTQRQRARITRLACLTGIAVFFLLTVASLALLIFSGRSPARLVSGIVFFLAFVASIAAYLLHRREQHLLANWILLAILLTMGVVPSFIFSGTGLLAALILLSVAVILASFVLHEREILLFFWAGLGSLLIAQFADTFGSTSRPIMLQPAVATTISIIMAVVLILVLAIRFRSFPFRAKIMVSLFGLTASAILVVAPVSAYLSSQSLMQQGFFSLQSAARLVSGTIDQFVGSTKTNIEVEAQLPDLSQVLANANTSAQLLEKAEQTLQSLAKKANSPTDGKNYYRYLQAYLLLDHLGQVIYDTSGSQSNQDLSSTDLFLHSIQSPIGYVSPVYFTSPDKAVIYFSAQVQDQNGQPAGVLAARYDAAILQQFLLQNNNRVAEQSYAILVDENGLRLAQGTISSGLYKPLLTMDVSLVASLIRQSRLPPDYEATTTSEMPDLGHQLNLKAGSSNLTFRDGRNSDGPYYYGVTDFLQNQPWTVIYVAPQAVLLEPVMNQVQSIQLLGVTILIIALAVAYILSRILIGPVLNMTETAASIAEGNFVVRADVQTNDEIGDLGRSINELAGRMQTSLQNMERQVDERTQDLERRTSQLQAAAEIGRAVSTIHNINDLLERSSTLISNRFNFYHAGIFLVDETGRFAVLRAANSEGGKRMLARSHRLAVGQQGIVGYVTSTGRPRIALDVGADAVFFNNPDLPQTRSELALPLISGDRILGALDVQSDQPGAFTNEDVTVLQVLADFLAVAIENARLFLESQTALESIRHAYGELSERSWVDRLENVSGIGFRSLDQGVFSLAAEPLASGTAEGQKLSIPIRVRETLIGYVDAYKPSARGEWTKEELDTMDALVDQLGVALESARLFENTQLLAERERLVGDFNTHLQESLDVDTVLRTAVLEMRQMLGTKYVTLVLGKGNES